jgi:hypothetical protein
VPGRRILLVEGSDDEHVLKNICGMRGVPLLDEIKNHEGVVQLLQSIPVRLNLSQDGDIVGVVIDADANIASRWQSLREALNRLGYQSIPTTPAPEGTIVPPPEGTILPRVGIWIMPDNQTDSILEDFLRFLVPEESPLFEHVQSSVAAIPDNERLFGKLAEPKAIIHTWLAWQEDPGNPYGLAIKAGYLDSTVSQVDVLVSWLNRLFFQ